MPGASSREIVRAADFLRARGVRKIGPYSVTKTMSSSISACLATPFKIKGLNYSITSACATSAHCIGAGAEQIQWGKQDVIFAGGGEELDWTLSCLFDAMGAMSSKYNDAPETAARAFDVTRDGFVIAGGAAAGNALSHHFDKARIARFVEYGGLSCSSPTRLSIRVSLLALAHGIPRQ